MGEGWVLGGKPLILPLLSTSCASGTVDAVNSNVRPDLCSQGVQSDWADTLTGAGRCAGDFDSGEDKPRSSSTLGRNWTPAQGCDLP